MTETTVLALTRLEAMHHTYHDSIASLRDGKQQLKQVKRGISKLVSPLMPTLQRFRRDWSPLSILMEQQATLVDTIGTNLTDMATSCEGDRETLLNYVEMLEARIGNCQEKEGTLERALGKNEVPPEASLVKSLRYGLERMDLERDRKRNSLKRTNAGNYLQEITRLLPIATEVHHTFASAAEAVVDWGTHLHATSETYARLIAFGHTSRNMQGTLHTINATSEQVYGAVDNGVGSIFALFKKLRSGSYTPKIKLLTTAKKSI